MLPLLPTAKTSAGANQAGGAKAGAAHLVHVPAECKVTPSNGHRAGRAKAGTVVYAAAAVAETTRRITTDAATTAATTAATAAATATATRATARTDARVEATTTPDRGKNATTNRGNTGLGRASEELRHGKPVHAHVQAGHSELVYAQTTPRRAARAKAEGDAERRNAHSHTSTASGATRRVAPFKGGASPCTGGIPAGTRGPQLPLHVCPHVSARQVPVQRGEEFVVIASDAATHAAVTVAAASDVAACEGGAAPLPRARRETFLWGFSPQGIAGAGSSTETGAGDGAGHGDGDRDGTRGGPQPIAAAAPSFVLRVDGEVVQAGNAAILAKNPANKVARRTPHENIVLVLEAGRRYTDVKAVATAWSCSTADALEIMANVEAAQNGGTVNSLRGAQGGCCGGANDSTITLA